MYSSKPFRWIAEFDSQKCRIEVAMRWRFTKSFRLGYVVGHEKRGHVSHRQRHCYFGQIPTTESRRGRFVYRMWRLLGLIPVGRHITSCMRRLLSSHAKHATIWTTLSGEERAWQGWSPSSRCGFRSRCLFEVCKVKLTQGKVLLTML